MKKASKFASVLLLLAFPVVAQQGRTDQEGGTQTQEITGSLEGAHNLKVRVQGASIRIHGDSQSTIRYTLHNRSFASSEYKVHTSVHGDSALIMGEWEGGRPHWFAGELVVDVPHDLQSVRVETDGGGITVNGIAGRVETQSGGGPIRLDDIGGSVNAETGGDNVEVGSIGGDLKVQTGGGRVSIGSVKGAITASTGGGDMVLTSGQQGAFLEAGGGNIQVKQCAGKLKISTGGGNIDVGSAGGPVDLETGGGSIHLGSAKGLVRAQTGAGRIELNGIAAARAETAVGGILARFVAPNGEHMDSQLETAAGDITVYLAPELNVTVRASIEAANGHTVHSDFPEIRPTTEGGQWGPRTVDAEGSLNGGGPELKVSTTTGDIWLRRASR